jgi:hypothetical protein
MAWCFVVTLDSVQPCILPRIGYRAVLASPPAIVRAAKNFIAFVQMSRNRQKTIPANVFTFLTKRWFFAIYKRSLDAI